MPGIGLTATKRRPAVFGSRSISAERSPSASRSGSPGERLNTNSCWPSAARTLMARPSSRMSSVCETFWPELGDAAVDGHAPGANPFLDRTARAQATLGEIFLEPLGGAGRRRTRTRHELSCRLRSRRTAAPPRGPRRNRPGAESSSSSASSSDGGIEAVIAALVRTGRRLSPAPTAHFAANPCPRRGPLQSLRRSRPLTGNGSCRLRSVSDLSSASGGRSSIDFSEK